VLLGETMNYLEIRNWSRYQHYKDRRPPWVKLHVDVLTDEKLTALDVPTRLLALLLLAVAANRDNKIPHDARWLAVETNMPASQVKRALATLLATRYLVECKSASNGASPSRAPARSQEAEAEAETASGSPSTASHFRPPTAEIQQAREYEVDKLLRSLRGADEGSRGVLLSAARDVPVGAIAKVRESCELHAGKVGVGYAVNALKSEASERAA
jgi:hypothetical protein